MKYIGLIVLHIACIAISCSSFLEEKSQDEVIPSSVADFREILLNYQVTGYTSAILAMDDDVAIDESQYWGSGDFFLAVIVEGCFTWQPDMWERSSTLSDNYALIYENIKAMNAILEKIDEAEGSEMEKSMVKAQALGWRAYLYFVLVNTFGEPYNYNKNALGVVLKLESAYEDKGLVRSTVEDVYARVVEDMEMASNILNANPKSRGDYLINCTAADILLSRIYLYMEDWDKVIEVADRAIGTAEGLFDYTTLPVGPRFYMTSYDNPEVQWIFANTNVPSSLFKVSDDLMSKFSEGDRRKEFLPGDFNGIGKTVVNGSGPSVMVRIAEAYLNRAEAKVLASKPDIEGALSDLNELRRHRIANYSDISIASVDELLEEIREERRKELCFEGHRWFDLRRYGMPSISHDFRLRLAAPLLRYTLEEQDPLYTLPIPRNVLENNVEMEQNTSALRPEREGSPI